MANIELGTIRDYWKATSDWILGLSISSPKITVSSPLPSGTNLIGKVGIDQTTQGVTNGVSIVEKEANAFEQITIPNTAGGTILTSATYATNTKAYITVENNNIRFRIDGGIPTATLGHLAVMGGLIELNSNSDIVNFKGIAVSETSAVLNCTYLS